MKTATLTFRLLFAVAAALTSYVLATSVLGAPVTTDEGSYLFQAVNFSEGRIARPFPPYPEAFAHPMIILDEEAGWLSRYAPGHPLWLVPGVIAGDPHAVVALGAGLSVLAVAATAAGLGGAPTIAGFLLAVSPFFLFIHATLLSHTSGILATALLLLTYSRWRNNGHILWAVLAGSAWGWLFLNRTLTAACLAIPFGVDALMVSWQRHHRRQTIVGAAAFALSAACGVIALAAYNAIAVGDPLTSTYLFYDPSEALGFGRRHVFGIPVDHTLGRGLEQAWANLVLLNRWLWGIPVSLGVVSLLFLAGWRRAGMPLLAGGVVSIVLGHVFFWFPGIRMVGPVYLSESLPFLVVGASLGIRSVVERIPSRWVTPTGAIAAVLLVAGSAFFQLDAGTRLHEVLRPLRSLLQELRDAPKDSLVLVEPGPSSELLGRYADLLLLNPHGLDSDPLVAWGTGTLGENLAPHFAPRTPYVLEATPGAKLRPFTPSRGWLAVLEAQQMHSLLPDSMRSDPQSPENLQRFATAGRQGEGWLAFRGGVPVFPGRFELLFDVVSEPCDDGRPPGRVDAAECGGGTVLAEQRVSRHRRRGAERLVVDVSRFACLEARVYYYGCGSLGVSEVRIHHVETREGEPR